jgi:hypothetical protein
MPGWFGRIVAGVVGGLAGGAVFGVLMQLTGTIPMIASLVDRESIVVGWAVHMSIAMFVGLTYTLIFGLFTEGLPMSTTLGAFYGIIWWVLGGLTLMPLRLGVGLFVIDTAAWQSLAGHAGYGLVLGAVYAAACRVLGRRDPAESEPLPVTDLPAAAPAPEPPAPEPPMSLFQPLAARPRSGVSPLPPAARALRQRGRPPQR